MTNIPLEKRFSILCEIVRAQHFAWREAALEMCPEVDTARVVKRMWEITGRDTARAYLNWIDPSKPLAEQVARSVASASSIMRESLVVEIPPESGGNEALLRHTECPWVDWHRRLRLLDEDRPGCDAWFQSTVDHINRELGTKLRVETLESLPEGCGCCLRRFWVEP
ncbi:MAG: hypothetical protein GY946_11855 [bacterium]|nr:hypothetical protein [bacterium]